MFDKAPRVQAERQHLSLEELEAFDPRSSCHSQNLRFLCPFCGTGKPHDVAHRSLWANVMHGGWKCHRCDRKGTLREYWRCKQPQGVTKVRALGEVDRKFSLPVASHEHSTICSQTSCDRPTPAENALSETAQWKQQLHNICRIEGTKGEAYLSLRGIDLGIANRSQVRFSPTFYGRPAVVFPIRTLAGELVAVQGRYIHDGDHAQGLLKTQTAGRKSLGVFATSGALEALSAVAADTDVVTITEAPLDALSLAMCGVPAVALCGKDGYPQGLLKACAYRRVRVAFDADEAGDKAALKLMARLAEYGVATCRLRPQNAKDWNEMLLQHGEATLKQWLRGRIDERAIY